MMSKMHPRPQKGGDGSKIAIIFNGSPLFTGDAGSGESNIRRWIIENDMLDAIVALPDQLFYNTGIFTYIWFVSNKKPKERQGKVQLIDATKHFQKMKKSLGNKRNEFNDSHIDEITRLYADYKHNAKVNVIINGKSEKRICNKILDNQDFGYIKVAVERPLRLNFSACEERIARLQIDEAFTSYSTTKPAKGKKQSGDSQLQEDVLFVVRSIGDKLYKNRDLFATILELAFEKAGTKIDAKLKKIILNNLSEKDPAADICLDTKGNQEPDPDLRDTENISLPRNIPLPLPIGYDNEARLEELVGLIKEHCEVYMSKEVLPHVSDAWIDYSKTKIGFEVPFNRHFYKYNPPRELEAIENDIKVIEKNILQMLHEVI